MDPEEQQRLSEIMAATLLQVHADMTQLDEETRDALQAMFEAAAEAAAKVIRANSGRDGRVPPESLPIVAGQIEIIMAELRDRQIAELQTRIGAAAANGAELISALASASGIPAAAIASLPVAGLAADQVLQVVLNTTAQDGLNLSDRIWRNYQNARADLMPAISRAVLDGQAAADAARAFVGQQGVPDELLQRIAMARAGALGDRAREVLASPEARFFADTLRVFRTEMDRANILATRAGIYETEGVVGTRFMLSPSHPRYDICDVHASVNLYGLGRGVYPPGASPLPAHPNTLSYEEAVFDWEVTDEDHDGREDLMGFLSGRTDDELYSALGQSWPKVRALRAGLLQPDEITLPWRELAAKYGAQVEEA